MARFMLPIPIEAAREIAERYGYDQVVIIARRVGEDPDPHGEHVTTAGVDETHCLVAARMAVALKRFMGWPEEEIAKAHRRAHFEPDPHAERLAEALRFYANEDSWSRNTQKGDKTTAIRAGGFAVEAPAGQCLSDAVIDHGERARAALKAYRSGKDG